MKMKLRLLCVCLVVTLIPNCQRSSDERKARRLLAEIDSIMDQQEASLRALPPNAAEIFSRENLNRFPANRGQVEAPAREMMRLNESHLAWQQEMAGKFDEISRLNLDNNFRRYASLQARVFRKRAEGISALNERLALLLDKSISDQQTFRSRGEGVNQRLRQIDEETKELEAQLASVPKPSVR